MGWRIPLTLVLALILGLLVGVSVYATQITKLPTTIEIPKAYGPCKKCRDLILLGRLLYECWHSPYWSTKTFVPKAYEYKVCIGGKCDPFPGLKARGLFLHPCFGFSHLSRPACSGFIFQSPGPRVSAGSALMGLHSPRRYSGNVLGSTLL